MQIGDLVRHVVHSGALGIIVDWNDLNRPRMTKVRWFNNGWGEKWELSTDFEVINENR